MKYSGTVCWMPVKAGNSGGGFPDLSILSAEAGNSLIFSVKSHAFFFRMW
ncbi:MULTISPECIES: hypothetical protein [unclassified Akkermansia]|nr:MULTISPECIES: hypothetical protein [unclassified Akkermansia]